MIVVDRDQYSTAAEIREQLGDDTTAELLRHWKRRRLITGHRIGRSNVVPTRRGYRGRAGDMAPNETTPDPMMDPEYPRWA
jgi:hypothetical protein